LFMKVGAAWMAATRILELIIKSWWHRETDSDEAFGSTLESSLILMRG
jgi:hypothetical protein